MSAAVQRVSSPTNVVDLRPGQLRHVIRRRVDRARHFNPKLFADPAWDILLDLGFTRLSGEPLVYRAAADLPPPSLCRWVDLLVSEGLAATDAGEPRISDAGLAALSAWLSGD